MADRQLAALVELQACETAGLVKLPADLAKAIGVAARLSERRNELRPVADPLTVFSEAAEKYLHAAGQPGGRWPSVEAIAEAERAEAQRVTELRVAEYALSRAAGFIDAVLADSADTLIGLLDDSLQRLVHDKAVLADADAVPVGASADDLIRQGGAMADAFNRLAGAVGSIGLLTAAWAVLLNHRCPPTEAPVAYWSMVDLPEGMGSVWPHRPMMLTDVTMAPWGRASDDVARVHYLLTNRTPVRLRTGAQLDDAFSRWQSSLRAERAKASA